MPVGTGTRAGLATEKEVTMFVADRYINIKEYDGENEITDGMVEKLDNMLWEEGIKHFMALPLDKDEDGYALPDHLYSLMYDSADELKVEIIMLHWAATVWHCSEERLLKCMRRISREKKEEE